ncbi:MAG: S24 family peptidase [Flavobacteriales bacterium]|jgi:phage repressor protein C with HTH and peptisase S24 domain|nr:S24 family peptidase [Flavobacteriales bacterium]
MVNNFTTIKDRVIQIIDNKEVSKESFFRTIGMTSANFRGKAKETPLNSNAIKEIITNYPEINLQWLITGEGEMVKEDSAQPVSAFNLKTDSNISQQRIPLYNIEATAGLIPLFDNHSQIETEEYISIPHVPRCDGALFVTGDSMYPLLKSGDIVAYQKVHDKRNYIFWGEMYLISVDMGGEEYVTVKYVQKSDEGKEYIKLVSQNSHHQPQDVHIDDVRALALVKASIRINSM